MATRRLLSLSALSLFIALGDATSAEPLPAPYPTLCAPCHGEHGAGDGPAADLMWPRPTSLVDAPRPLGGDPASVRRAISDGVPGTAMPAFGATLDAATLDRLVAALAPDPVSPIAPPPTIAARLAPARWQTHCTPCHGVDARGDGPLAATLRDANGDPADLYDLRTTPLKGGDTPSDLLATLDRGRPGTPMPAFATLPAADRHALVGHLLALRALAEPDPTPRLPPPGASSSARDPYWTPRPLPDPGPPPAGQTPALADATPARCGLCHPAQHQSWSQSRHAAAAGPGLVGQYHGADPAFAPACDACHAPLHIQRTDPERHTEGVTCAACHIRAHQKHGPPGPTSMRFPAPALAARPDPRFARSDFCLPCHNLPLAAAVDGAPLLDTWREWAQSPYLPAGVQCQHCHQPDGDHAVPGAHDPTMARRAVTLDLALDPADPLTATATVRNVGAGHHFPTTATPRAVLRIRQLGPDGPLPDTEALWALGRTVERKDGRWITVADTRIPAGQATTRHYRHPRHPRATRLEASLHLFPDYFYARFFRAALTRPGLAPAARADFQTALTDAEGSAILLHHRRLPLP